MCNQYIEEGHRDDKFDPYVIITGEYSSDLVDRLLTDCEKVESRKRKRKEKNRDAFRAVLTTIVANAIKVMDRENGSSIHYSRKADAFCLKHYFPKWLGHTNLILAISSLKQAGYLTTIEAKSGNPRTTQFRTLIQSTFQATSMLKTVCNEFGINNWSTSKSDEAPVLFLKDSNKTLIGYDTLNDRIIEAVAGTRRFNGYVTQHELALRQCWPEATECDRTLSKVDELDLDQTFLYRVYNNGSLDEGGRWFGGWWQECPSLIRPYITIEGQRTVELDYSGFLTRALYHQDNINYGDADPYYLPEIMEIAQKRKMNLVEVRQSIKKLMNVLINADEHHRIGKISDLWLPFGYKLPSKVYALLETKHQIISHHFRSGVGVKMMAKESEICRRILLEGMDKGILVLPIHDSYIVQERHEDWLRSAMHSHYQQLFGFLPVVKGGRGASQSVEQLASSNSKGDGASELVSADLQPTGGLSIGDIIRGPSKVECIRPEPAAEFPTESPSDDQEDSLWAAIAFEGPSNYDPMR